MLFFGCLGRYNKLAKCKQITFNRGNFTYHRSLLTAWLAPMESNKNKYPTNRQYLVQKRGKKTALAYIVNCLEFKEFQFPRNIKRSMFTLTQ